VGGQRVVNTKRQPAFVLRRTGPGHGTNAVGGQRVVNTESRNNSILSQFLIFEEVEILRN